jgi:hypothetical protein
MSFASYESIHDLGLNERHDCGATLEQVITCTDCPVTKTVPVKWNRMDSQYDVIGGLPTCECGSEDWVRGEISCACGYQL